jgi:hypothetical protein
MKTTPRASTTNALPLFFHESAAYNQFITRISSLAQQWKTRSAGINFELSLKYSNILHQARSKHAFNDHAWVVKLGIVCHFYF